MSDAKQNGCSKKPVEENNKTYNIDLDETPNGHRKPVEFCEWAKKMRIFRENANPQKTFRC